MPSHEKSAAPDGRRWPGLALRVLLALLPLIFIAGHGWSRGTVWNHVTGATFHPLTNWVSDYVYRSPVWPLFSGCIHAFALVLVVISWRVFRSFPTGGVRMWLFCVLTFFAAMKLVEVAVFPVKPPEVAIEQLQSRMDQSSWERLRDESVTLWRKVRGGGGVEAPTAAEVVSAFESNSGHLTGIRSGMAAILLAMAMSLTLPLGPGWRVRAGACLVAAVLAVALTGSSWFGLWQRLAFFAVYAWMGFAVGRLFPLRLIPPSSSHGRVPP